MFLDILTRKTLSGQPFFRRITLTLFSICGNQDLEQIDRDRCAMIPLKFVLRFFLGGGGVAAKEF